MYQDTDRSALTKDWDHKKYQSLLDYSTPVRGKSTIYAPYNSKMDVAII